MDESRELKIVFTGPMGAGKTTAIAAISDVPPVSTDVANNDLAADTILLTDDITLTHATETSLTYGNTGLTPVTTPITTVLGYGARPPGT